VVIYFIKHKYTLNITPSYKFKFLKFLIIYIFQWISTNLLEIEAILAPENTIDTVEIDTTDEVASSGAAEMIDDIIIQISIIMNIRDTGAETQATNIPIGESIEVEV
jgi:hypothetical protein